MNRPKAIPIGSPVERAIAILDPDSREALQVENATLRQEVADLRMKVESGMYAAALIILAGGGTQVRIPSVPLATVAAGTRLESTGDPVTGDIIFRVRRPS